MVKEKSAGIIVFRINPQEGVQYLVLYHRGTYWNFPKGKLDPGENEKQAAVRELSEEAGIKNIKLIDGWRQETNFFFKEDRQGKKELIKKDFILFLAKMPKDEKVDITRDCDGNRHNGYAWLDYKTADKYLKFKSIRGIFAEANSFILDKIRNYQRSKDSR